VFVLLHLESHLGRGILGGLALVAAEVELVGADLGGAVGERGDGGEVKVGVEVPEHGAGDADEGAVGQVAATALDGGNGLIVDDDLVEAGLDEAAGQVLELLAGLDKQVVAGGDLDGEAGAGVACPDVEAGVAGAAVDGEEVEVGVEAGKDGVLLAVLVEVGGRGSEEMRARRRG
jgi:hypothetical protein